MYAISFNRRFVPRYRRNEEAEKDACACSTNKSMVCWHLQRLPFAVYF